MKPLHLLLAIAAATPVLAQPSQEKGDRRPPPVPPLFAVLDTDHDGALSTDELKAAGESLEKLDRDGDGEITLKELRLPPPQQNRDGAGEEDQDDSPASKPRVPPVIAALDTDKDGTISASELEAAPESLKKLDKDGDGELSPEELHPHGPPPRDGSGPPQGAPPENEEGPAAE